jgi:hypothetical protein
VGGEWGIEVQYALYRSCDILAEERCWNGAVDVKYLWWS